MMDEREITLGDVVKSPEALGSLYKVYRNNIYTPHNALVSALKSDPQLVERMEELEVLPTYFAYVLEHVFSKVHLEVIPVGYAQ